MTQDEEVIRNFILAWLRFGAEELVKYFSKDGIYHNMSAPTFSLVISISARTEMARRWRDYTPIGWSKLTDSLPVA